MFRFYRPPGPLRSLFPSVIWKGKPDRVYLTFDDGPDPVRTLQILGILEEFQVPAAFFTLGIKVNKYLHVVERIRNGGHEIGIHAFHHRSLVFAGRRSFEEELLETGRLIRPVTGSEPVFFRPPYGTITPWMVNRARKLNYRTVLWSYLTYDFAFRDPVEFSDFTVRNIRPGDILVFHDGHRNSELTIQALPRIIERTRNQYSFGKLTDLI